MKLEIKNLDKHFRGVYAVKNLSFVIDSGSITSIIGPNGAGKTTLTNLISGVLKIDSGILQLGDEEFSQIKSYKIMNFGITRTFQNVRLFEQMTVLDNILIVLTKKSIWQSLAEGKKSQDKYLNKAYSILDKVGLSHKKDELAVNLSYGQRKLLEIGRVLAGNAKIIILDEPFAGLFPEMVKTVIGIIKDLKKQDKTVVLIEHNMELIRELSDEVIVLDSGELLAQGKPEEILNKKEVIEAYLGE